MYSFIWTVLLGSQLDGQNHVEDAVVLEKGAILDTFSHYVLDPSFFFYRKSFNRNSFKSIFLGLKKAIKMLSS